MNINLELYKYFYYVAKNNSISRAASELYISQPGLTLSIQKLEELLNTKLFIRKRDGVTLTETGNVLYAKVRDAMELIDAGEEEVKAMTTLHKGTLNIGTCRTILFKHIMKYIIGFHKEYPNIKIKYTPGKSINLLKHSNLGLYDIIFTNLPDDIPYNLEAIKLRTLHDCFVSSTPHEKISINELSELPLIVLNKETTTRRQLDKFCYKNGIKIHPIIELEDNNLIQKFTEEGYGVGLLTEEHIKKELESGKLYKIETDKELDPKYLSMVYNPESNNIVLQEFIEYIKKHIT